jgi:hypothetical protein
MDDITTSGADVVGEDQAVTDPAAPWGINPRTGKPYKRDPDVMRRVREARFAGGRGPKPRAASPARASQKAGPAAPKKRTPRYGETVARWFVTGSSAILADPIEQHIMRTQSVQLAVIVDRVLEEDPRLVAWIERLRLRLAGGAKGELLAWGAMTGGLVAVNRGYRHPVLVFALGGALEAIKVGAVAYEQAQAEERQKMAALMAEYAAEEERAKAEYEAALSASMDRHPAGSATSVASGGPTSVFGQFG